MKSLALATALSLCAGAAFGGEPKRPTTYVLLVNAVLDRQTFSAPHPEGKVDAEFDIGADGFVVSARLHGSDPRLVALTRSKLAQIGLPPPPGGHFHLRHSFVFAREGQAR